MFIEFFLALRAAGVPVSLKEFLLLLQALQARLAFASLDDFYYLSRAALVKDEKWFDRFDRVFANHFNGASWDLENLQRDIPEDWLRKLVEKHLSEEDKAALEAMGFRQLMDTLKQRLAEQRERHQGGNKWIGTGGTSPFGAYGYNPAGVRIGQDGSRHRRAVKVWDQREFRDLDGDSELGARGMKIALRRLRQFARDGATEELDIDATIAATARQAGLLDLRYHPRLHDSTKVLLLLDIGGSMDDHVHTVETLFSAVRSEFKHLEHFYFHNCVYESLWKHNARRWNERTPTLDMLHTYGRDYQLILVGDARMSPYELVYPGGSVEHHNEEAGQVWLKRLLAHYPHAVWINPCQEAHWDYSESTRLIHQLMAGRMCPLTVEGLERGIRMLKQSRLGVVPEAQHSGPG